MTGGWVPRQERSRLRTRSLFRHYRPPAGNPSMCLGEDRRSWQQHLEAEVRGLREAPGLMRVASPMFGFLRTLWNPRRKPFRAASTGHVASDMGADISSHASHESVEEWTRELSATTRSAAARRQNP